MTDPVETNDGLDLPLPDPRGGGEPGLTEIDEGGALRRPRSAGPDPREGEDTEDLQEGEVKDRATSERPGENTADAPYG